jgi:hypothetical protein
MKCLSENLPLTADKTAITYWDKVVDLNPAEFTRCYNILKNYFILYGKEDAAGMCDMLITLGG